MLYPFLFTHLDHLAQSAAQAPRFSAPRPKHTALVRSPGSCARGDCRMTRVLPLIAEQSFGWTSGRTLMKMNLWNLVMYSTEWWQLLGGINAG